MCVIDRHDMTLAVKVALNLNTTTTHTFPPPTRPPPPQAIEPINTRSPRMATFESIVGKEENAGKQHCVLL